MIRRNICNNNNLSHKGMTLIELLIAVAIVGVLTAIAYPSYTEYVIKSHRTAALADMAKIQLTLEQSYNGVYSWGNIISGGACTVCESPSDRYVFSVASSSSMAYLITATAQSTKGQNGDSCLGTPKTMTLKSSGEESPVDCWN
ncbi:prepilin-type N-terminal cleavage/methylation domain-containing protein [Vibrio tasmaniensis ZS-17]|uniref:type IV pilin protein n=1 Tax=Vibrio TaxID=662 RepID=UPI0002FA62AC|nr:MULTISPECIES: type IV pilin protein [Vibrio]OED66699.1 prepilin-type N-terminal cleavage/methylation domain-containing protein [Vibrio tasmaniensis ZS-17]PMJ04698.1 prepilin-type N-terminal cleavage/methylation domain-containing protein [Vibrio lentus]